MDGDPGEGPIVGSVKAARQPPGRGLLVDRSRATLIQIARRLAAVGYELIATDGTWRLLSRSGVECRRGGLAFTPAYAGHKHF